MEYKNTSAYVITYSLLPYYYRSYNLKKFCKKKGEAIALVCASMVGFPSNGKDH